MSGPVPDSEGPSHPKLAGALLMIGVVVLLVLIAVFSSLNI